MDDYTVGPCPQCGSKVWDNRSKIAKGEFNPKSPHFSCKDKGCGWAWWPPKKGSEATDHPKGESMEPRPSSVSMEQPKAAVIMQQPENNLEGHARHSREVFEKAWSESGEVMKTLMPAKDAEQLEVKDWYDLKLRIAQFIAIQTQRSL